MGQRVGAEDIVVARVREALSGAGPVVLAVSGGRDSMVMLEAATGTSGIEIAAVATFDHGTGDAATRAVRLVSERTAALGLPLRVARATTQARSEARWREARWSFLGATVRELGARCATAHTRDDQLETVLIRAMRGAGARGLAGLCAKSNVLRPLLGVTRSQVAAFADRRPVPWVEDPSNASRRHLRNRIRLDILPALRKVHPELEDDLLRLARQAAGLRDEIDQLAASTVSCEERNGTLTVSRGDLAHYDASSLALLWPTLAARVGVALDRRGTVRLAAFTIDGAPGQRIQLAGDLEVIRQRDSLVLRKVLRPRRDHPRPLADGVRFGAWRFSRDETEGPEDRLTALLPADRSLVVRAWRPGDRMVPHGAAGPRRVKGLFRDAGIDGPAREGWPVVLADDEIVWIPAVRRASAATVRSGRPAVRFRCDRTDR